MNSLVHDAAMKRMVQVRVIPTNWFVVIGELQRDWKRNNTVEMVDSLVEHLSKYGVIVESPSTNSNN